MPDIAGIVPAIINAAFNGNYTLPIPGALLTEPAETIKVRKHPARRFSPGQVSARAEALRIITEPVDEISEPVTAITRDPKDDYLLAYALLCRASYRVLDPDDRLDFGS